MEPRSDPRLEAAIRAVGAWRGRDIGVTPVSLGRDERHYLIEADDELFVLRLTSPASDRPSIDATSELEVASAAASAGVAPEVVVSLPQLGCLVTRFASGRHPTAADAERDDVLASVVGSVRALHAAPPPAGARSAFREARDLHRALVTRGVAMPASEPAATRTVDRIEETIGNRPRATVACHGDLTTASLFIDGEHTWIVDYRWAGAGDALEDLASLATHLEMSGKRSDALLALYFGAVDDDRRSRLALMRLTAEYLGGMRDLARASSKGGAEVRATERRFIRVLDGASDDRFDTWLGAASSTR